MDENISPQSSGYKKMKWWHWLLIYIALGSLVYGLAYYLMSYRNQANQQPAKNYSNQTQQNMQQTNPEGFKAETLKEGTGAQAKSGDKVTVNYVGTLTNGTKFDSSYDRGVPFQFTLGQNQVIAGWEMGVLGMKVGEKRKLTIPPELGYGANAVGPIPANSTLIFEVELLKIN